MTVINPQVARACKQKVTRDKQSLAPQVLHK